MQSVLTALYAMFILSSAIRVRNVGKEVRGYRTRPTSTSVAPVTPIVEAKKKTFQFTSNRRELLKLEAENEHPFDQKVTFNEKAHRYSFDGEEMHYSVTGVVKKYFEEFIPEVAADRMMKSKNWPRQQYIKPTGEVYTLEEVLTEWELGGVEARTLGSLMHSNIERYYNDLPYNTEQTPEFQQFQQFHKNIICRNNIQPYRTEWRIAVPSLGIGGSIDFIGKLPDGSFVIMDWKRSKTLPGSLDSGFKNALPPIDHLPDCDGIKYALQLNLYEFMLKNYYDIPISKLILLSFHPNFEKYFIYEVPNLQKEVEDMLQHLRSTSRVKSLYDKM